MFLKISLISIASLLLGTFFYFLFNRKSNGSQIRKQILPMALNMMLLALLYFSIVFIPLLLYILVAFIILIAFREILMAADKANRNHFLYLVVGGALLSLFALFIKNTEASFVLFTLFIVVHFDAFSSLIDENYGTRRIFSSAAGSATWEGLGIGVLVVLVLSILVFGFNELPKTFAQVSIFSLAAIFGTLFRQKVKRVAGIKEFSNLLPGQVGVLDRFGSFFVAGAVWQVLQMFYTH